MLCETEDTNLYPDRFSKIYFNCDGNIRDWCIPVQWWWGPPIRPTLVMPVVSWLLPRKLQKSVEMWRSHFTQDPDALDTWFKFCPLALLNSRMAQDTADLENSIPMPYWSQDMILFSSGLPV